MELRQPGEMRSVDESCASWEVPFLPVGDCVAASEPQPILYCGQIHHWIVEIDFIQARSRTPLQDSEWRLEVKMEGPIIPKFSAAAATESLIGPILISKVRFGVTQLKVQSHSPTPDST